MSSKPSLIEILNEHLASEQLQLPVVPGLAVELQTMLGSEEENIEQISRKIAADQVLASQVLRIANSAFFNGLTKVTTIKDSILRLGTRKVTSVVFMITQQQQYGCNDNVLRPYMQSLWRHAASCALGSKWLVERIGYKDLAEEAFVAGLLHDIGNLLLLKVLEALRKSSEHEENLSETVLSEVLDHMHAAQGAALLKQWNLPDVYCEVIAKHHDEDFKSTNPILPSVRLVDLACHKLGIGLHRTPSIILASTPEAQALEVSDLLAAELEIVLEDSAEGAAA